jgi:hypothetical protein
VKEEVGIMSWMTLTSGIVGFLGLAGIVAVYAGGMAADGRTRQEIRGRRGYLRGGEELVGERRAA